MKLNYYPENNLSRIYKLLRFIFVALMLSLAGCCFTDQSPPDSPQGVSRSITGNQVKISWSANVEADLVGYNIDRVNVADGILVRLTSNAIPTTEYVDATAASSVEYNYTVTAIDDCGNESPPSTPVIVNLLPGASTDTRVVRLLQDGTIENDRLEFIDLATGDTYQTHDFPKNAFLRGSDLVSVKIDSVVYGLFQPRSGITHIYQFSDGQEVAQVPFTPTPTPSSSIPGVEPVIAKIEENGTIVSYGISIDSQARLVAYNITTGQVVGRQNLADHSDSNSLSIEEDVDLLVHDGDASANIPPELFVQVKNGEVYSLSLPELNSVTKHGKLSSISEVAVDPQVMGNKVVFEDAQGNLLVVDRSTNNSTYTRQANIQTNPQGTIYNDAARREVDLVSTSDGQFGVQLTGLGHAYVLDHSKLDPNGSQSNAPLTILPSPFNTRSIVGVDPVIARYDPNIDITPRLLKGRIIVGYKPNIARMFSMDGTLQWTFEGPMPITTSTGKQADWEKNIDLLLGPKNASGFSEIAILRYGGNMIRIVRLSDGRLLHTILDSPYRQPVQGVDPMLTPDGRYLIDISADLDKKEAFITIHGVAPPQGTDLGTFGEQIEVQKTFPLPKFDVDLFIESTGSWAGFMDSTGGITLFDLQGRVLRNITASAGFSGAVIGVDVVTQTRSIFAAHLDQDWVLEEDPPQDAPSPPVDPPPFLPPEDPDT